MSFLPSLMSFKISENGNSLEVLTSVKQGRSNTGTPDHLTRSPHFEYNMNFLQKFTPVS